jgi:hypothetical protein
MGGTTIGQDAGSKWIVGQIGSSSIVGIRIGGLLHAKTQALDFFQRNRFH